MNSQYLLAQFRQNHKIQHIVIDGHTWSYNTGGQGESCILLLPGGGSNGDFGAEILFPMISDLEHYARFISVGYPSTVTRVKQIVDALPRIIAACDIDHAIVIGHSAGGQFAQVFMLTYPEHVDAMVIINSAIYRSLGSVLSLKIFSPGFVNLVDPIVKKVMARRFVKRFITHPDSKFWTNYMDEHMASLPERTLANDYMCLEDFTNNYAVTSEDVKQWGGPALLIESDNDTGFTLKERLYLRGLYPNAKVCVIKNGGHFSFVMRTDECNKAVRDFIITLHVP